MLKYPIKTPKHDFRFLKIISNTKGSRVKRIIIDKQGKKAFFKYEGNGYIVSEACSEKMSYEISVILGYRCAKIELAIDEKGTLGILNYLFIETNDTEHIDAVSYINLHNEERATYYTIPNIKRRLDELDKNLFQDFIKIVIFDALIGEQDRHEENWGIERSSDGYKISPLYDNGCSLLREFKNENLANNFYTKKKSFESYIKRSKSMIYEENSQKRYKHFELVDYLNKHYHNIVQKEIQNLNKLTDKKIENIVQKIPDNLLTDIHKDYIIDYLKKRRDILLDIK